MKLVHFLRHDGKGTITFAADKIVAFTRFIGDPAKTSIFVAGAEDDDEFIVGETYEQVIRMMSAIK